MSIFSPNLNYNLLVIRDQVLLISFLCHQNLAQSLNGFENEPIYEYKSK